MNIDDGASSSRGSSALDLFAHAAATRPQAAAIVYANAALSFADLDRASDALAAWLASQGAKAGDRVCTIFQNTPEAAIVALATWKCGAVLMPCNPMYHRDELARLFADAEPRFIICSNDVSGTVRAALALTDLDAAILESSVGHENGGAALGSKDGGDFSDALRRWAGQPYRRAAPAADDVAVLLYTSGTTGTPKGAMLTHANLHFVAEICRVWFRLDSESKILAVAPLFHVTGVVCHLLAAFAARCTLLLVHRFEPNAVLATMREHRPTFTIGAITVFIALMNHPDIRDDDFSSFSLVYSGGAPIPAAITEAFESRFGLPIHLSYGMTETSAPALLNPPGVRAPHDPSNDALAVGIAVDGTEIRIVDDAGADLPNGEAGELLMRGPQVMRGYWRRSEDTAAVLTNGWMHSGDIAIRDARGWVYIVDRKKDMICASGFKVWPREVEEVLYQLDAVREAVVVGKPDPYRGETVVAYLSLRERATLVEDHVIAHTRAMLAAYKCPREVIILHDLPKTASGKLSRVTLRERAAAT